MNIELECKVEAFSFITFMTLYAIKFVEVFFTCVFAKPELAYNFVNIELEF